MKKLKTSLAIKVIASTFLLTLLICLLVNTVHAQSNVKRQGSLKSNVTGQVGEYYLNLYGYVSPFASVVLIIDGVVYRGTVADENGNWSFTGVLIKEGFDGFCLQAVDFKRLGESLTCFTVPPATGSITMRDIFLPPTIGLQRSQIAAGGDAVVFGYTMPGAMVTIHLQNGVTFTVRADQFGYYEYTIKNLAAGEYSLFATANYNGRESVKPSSTVKLVAIPLAMQTIDWLKNLLERLIQLFTSIGLGPLWLLIPLIPFIVWLVTKIWPSKFTIIYNSKLYAFFSREDKKLHHAWYFGY